MNRLVNPPSIAIHDSNGDSYFIDFDANISEVEDKRDVEYQEDRKFIYSANSMILEMLDINSNQVISTISLKTMMKILILDDKYVFLYNSQYYYIWNTYNHTIQIERAYSYYYDLDNVIAFKLSKSMVTIIAKDIVYVIDLVTHKSPIIFKTPIDNSRVKQIEGNKFIGYSLGNVVYRYDISYQDIIVKEVVAFTSSKMIKDMILVNEDIYFIIGNTLQRYNIKKNIIKPVTSYVIPEYLSTPFSYNQKIVLTDDKLVYQLQEDYLFIKNVKTRKTGTMKATNVTRFNVIYPHIKAYKKSVVEVMKTVPTTFNIKNLIKKFLI